MTVNITGSHHSNNSTLTDLPTAEFPYIIGDGDGLMNAIDASAILKRIVGLAKLQLNSKMGVQKDVPPLAAN